MIRIRVFGVSEMVRMPLGRSQQPGGLVVADDFLLDTVVNQLATQEIGEVAQNAEESLASEEIKGTDFDTIDGVTKKTIQNLKDSGFITLEKIAQSSIKDLTMVKGLGELKAKKIIESVQTILNADG